MEEEPTGRYVDPQVRRYHLRTRPPKKRPARVELTNSDGTTVVGTRRAQLDLQPQSCPTSPQVGRIGSKVVHKNVVV